MEKGTNAVSFVLTIIGGVWLSYFTLTTVVPFLASPWVNHNPPPPLLLQEIQECAADWGTIYVSSPLADGAASTTIDHPTTFSDFQQCIENLTQ